MKRITRQRSEETKRKISESLRGKSKTEQHKRAISVALKKYWKTIPPTTVRYNNEGFLHYQKGEM